MGKVTGVIVVVEFSVIVGRKSILMNTLTNMKVFWPNVVLFGLRL